MINRFIDELTSELFESRLAQPLVNSVNSHIIKKMLNSGAINHIFCNRSLFISFIPKTSICETGTREKFILEKYESVIMTLINENN